MWCGLGSNRCCRRCRGGWVARCAITGCWWRRDLAVPHGFTVAGPAGGVRAVADGVEAARRFTADGVWDQVLTVLLTEADAAGSWTGRCRWTPRSPAPASTADTTREVVSNDDRHAGAHPNYANLLIEPRDHGVGRSRGGLTSKLHTMVDGRGRPLVLIVTAGQANDPQCCPPCCKGCGCPGWGRVDPGPGPRRSWLTRRTPPGRAVSGCAPLVSPRSSPNPPTSRPPRPTRLHRCSPTRLRPGALPRPQRRRTQLRPHEAVAWSGHPL